MWILFCTAFRYVDELHKLIHILSLHKIHHINIYDLDDIVNTMLCSVLRVSMKKHQQMLNISETQEERLILDKRSIMEIIKFKGIMRTLGIIQ